MEKIIEFSFIIGVAILITNIFWYSEIWIISYLLCMILLQLICIKYNLLEQWQK